MHAFFLQAALFVMLSTVLLAGCAHSPPVRFYTLAPLGRPEIQNASRQEAFPGAVRIMPVAIPDYLDRPQIMTRDGKNVLRLAEFDRWAGSLGDNITAVLAENLGLLLASDHVFIHPGIGGEKTDFSVSTQVLRLDAKPGDRVILKARWIVSPGRHGMDATTRVATFSQQLDDSRYETLVAGVSRALEALSREMAREIIILSKTGKAGQNR